MDILMNKVTISALAKQGGVSLWKTLPRFKRPGPNVQNKKSG
jgi:hypothetical protein